MTTGNLREMYLIGGRVPRQNTGIPYVTDTYSRASGTNPENEMRMVTEDFRHTDGSPYPEPPQIYLTRTKRETIVGNLNQFMYEPMNSQTMTRITGIVEQMILAANNTLPQYRGRGIRTAIPGTNQLMVPADKATTNEDGSLYVQNMVSPPGSRDLKNSSYVTGYHWNPATGELRIDLQNESFELRRGEDSFNILDHQEYLRRRLRNNLVFKFKTRGGLVNGVNKEEWTAIDTLRELITEKEFRKYMKYGFLLVEGASGDVYQIFRDQWHTKIWRKGNLVEEVCVRLDPSVPPTDNVIAFMSIILTNESAFKKLGNVYKMSKAA